MLTFTVVMQGGKETIYVGQYVSDSRGEDGVGAIVIGREDGPMEVVFLHLFVFDMCTL